MEHRSSEQCEELICERKAPNMLKKTGQYPWLSRLYLKPARRHIYIVTAGKEKVNKRGRVEIKRDATDQLTYPFPSLSKCVPKIGFLSP